MSWRRKIGVGVVALALGGALVWALWPQPSAVDMAPVRRGPLQVSVSAEGMTRVREPYAITAPFAGTASRSPVEVGDRVEGGRSVVAVIRPAEPGLIDARTRRQAEAAVTEAEAAVALAETNLRGAVSNLETARDELARTRALAASGTIPRRMVDDMQHSFTTAAQALAGARSELDLHRATLARMEAQLLGPEAFVGLPAAPDDCCVQIVAPQTGTVLDVTDHSERSVQPGSPLLVIGDLQDLEIEIDLLSADAVRVPPEARALVERWGGDTLLEARVRRVEPAAFTRVSALGIEEQRVRLRLDILTPADQRPGLGDRFRVFVRVVLWQGDDLLLVPQSALFRQAGGWAVFRVEEGRARLTPVQIGRQAEGMAELLGGLAEGDSVILYPASSMGDGAAVVARVQ